MIDQDAFTQFLQVAQVNDDNDVFEVDVENVETINLFLKIDHCWRYVPSGGVAGIDWMQANTFLNMVGLDYSPQQIIDIRLIEQGVLTAQILEMRKRK